MPTAFISTGDVTAGWPQLKAYTDAVPVDQLSQFSVKHPSYAATGNGTADDTTAIHAARDAAGTGGVVYFPNGTYKTVAGLSASVASQRWILAPGATIQFATAVAGKCIDISASGVVIEGPGKVDGGLVSGSSCIFLEPGLTDVRVHRVELAHGTYGVRSKGASSPASPNVRVAVTDCHIHDQSSHGVHFNFETTDSEVSDNFIHDVGGNGVWGGSTSDRLIVSDNHIVNAAVQGIGLNGVSGSTGCPNSVVKGNEILSAGTIGISIDSSDGTKVSLNSIISSSSYGIELAGSGKCSVANNTIITPGSIGISISALTRNCNDNSIEGNTIDHPVGEGINAGGAANGAQRLRAIGNEIIEPGNGSGNKAAILAATGIGCDSWTVKGNTIYFVTSATGVSGISLNCANNVIKGNTIIFDAGIVTAGGTGINVPSTGLDNLVIGNMIVGNSKCATGVSVAAACTGVQVSNSRINGTTSAIINCLSTSNTCLVSNNIGTATSGSGFVLTSAIGIGNRSTSVGSSVLYAGSHQFSGSLGLGGVTPVALPMAAVTALPAAAPAGGTGTAAGGWDTAANRDAAIATINGLRTSVSDIKARLTSLGITL